MAESHLAVVLGLSLRNEHSGVARVTKYRGFTMQGGDIKDMTTL